MVVSANNTCRFPCRLRLAKRAKPTEHQNQHTPDDLSRVPQQQRHHRKKDSSLDLGHVLHLQPRHVGEDIGRRQLRSSCATAVTSSSLWHLRETSRRRCFVTFIRHPLELLYPSAFNVYGSNGFRYRFTKMREGYSREHATTSPATSAVHINIDAPSLTPSRTTAPHGCTPRQKSGEDKRST